MIDCQILAAHHGLSYDDAPAKALKSYFYLNLKAHVTVLSNVHKLA
jgi:hypothetical protein